ncbi:MAG: bifunctional phosphoribosyl-AMP cyclohydrolase/phosphoribosyl-ATP diphosphatase HisIE [Acholeplasmataceae bacterium]
MEPAFDENGLIPVIVQEDTTHEVLMLGYMNEESYRKTRETNELYFYSRKRNSLWKKGETSGNVQKLKSLSLDCDEDALLARVEQTGPACHTGNRSCFYRDLIGEKKEGIPILKELYHLIGNKKRTPDGGYTSYLFREGLDKILKKVAEEAGEVIIAAKNDNAETVYEISDLFYHVLVLMVEREISLAAVEDELRRRRK